MGCAMGRSLLMAEGAADCAATADNNTPIAKTDQLFASAAA